MTIIEDKPIKITFLHIENYLKDLKYPAFKDDIINAAQKHQAPQVVLHTLNRIANIEYPSLTEIDKAIEFLYKGEEDL